MSPFYSNFNFKPRRTLQQSSNLIVRLSFFLTFSLPFFLPSFLTLCPPAFLYAHRMNAPTDRSRWFMTPQTINAYYHPSLNEIVFPAAILQVNQFYFTRQCHFTRFRAGHTSFFASIPFCFCIINSFLQNILLPPILSYTHFIKNHVTFL